MDADNQAATMCGLLGIINGMNAIPGDLLYPVEDAGWEKPFNDTYKMITREGLEHARLTDLAERIAMQGEKVILAHGGEIITSDGIKYYRINTNAQYVPPFELNPIPDLHAEVQQLFSYPVYTGGAIRDRKLTSEGDLPPGININGSHISGIPIQEGVYKFKIIAEQGASQKSQAVIMIVHSQNLAEVAGEILYNKNTISHNIEIIRDGLDEETYYSIKKGDERETDYYGYLWDEPVEISAITYNNGIPQEYCGWFTSFNVEYLKENRWLKVANLDISPDMNLENTQWLKPFLMNYQISFTPVITKGIRIIGLSGGIPKDAANAHLGLQFYTAISELKVFTE
jgi:hypothetical protein